MLASTEELTTKKDGVSFQQFIEETYLPWYKTQVKESTYLNRATTIKKHFPISTKWKQTKSNLSMFKTGS